MNVEQNLDGRKKDILTTIDELSPEVAETFKQMIDDMILLSDGDKELREGFAEIGEESFRRKISLYDLMLEAYEKSEVEKSVKRWLKDKK